MTALLIGIAGWTGAIVILVAYILLSLEKLPVRSAAYQGMNVAGAACFVVNSGWHGAIPSAALNVVWAGIGLFALARMRAGSGRVRDEPGRH